MYAGPGPFIIVQVRFYRSSVRTRETDYLYFLADIFIQKKSTMRKRDGGTFRAKLHIDNKEYHGKKANRYRSRWIWEWKTSVSQNFGELSRFNDL